MGANKDAKLKAFMIFVDDNAKNAESKLTAIAQKTKAEDICLAYLSRKHEAVGQYKVNLDSEVKNTVMLYRRKRVVSKHVNLVADDKGLAELKTSIADLVK